MDKQSDDQNKATQDEMMKREIMRLTSDSDTDSEEASSSPLGSAGPAPIQGLRVYHHDEKAKFEKAELEESRMCLSGNPLIGCIGWLLIALIILLVIYLVKKYG